MAAYYVVAESLTNAAKHSQASAVKVRADIWGAKPQFVDSRLDVEIPIEIQ